LEVFKCSGGIFTRAVLYIETLVIDFHSWLSRVICPIKTLLCFALQCPALLCIALLILAPMYKGFALRCFALRCHAMLCNAVPCDALLY
jgi:hypothetical protein